ncbi:MAG: adenosylcobinamide-GDP ribazoletransferase [Synergistaceae bacterium]|nr:adenosylcobinamide-GDP ribazoletransferase [Synergistaceae bacterium]
MWTLITRLPLPAELYPRDASGLSAQALTVIPIAGGLFGAIAALPAQLLSLALPPAVCAWIACGIYAALGWGLHLDGWSDMCDAIGSGKRGEDMRSVMKDPHTGSYGVVGVVVAISIRASLLSSIDPGMWVAVSSLAGGVGRLSCAAAAYIGRYPWDSGIARGIVRDFNGRYFILAIVAACPFLALSPPAALSGIAVACLAGGGLASWSNGIMGGANGDILGAAAVLGELLVLSICAV